MANSEKMNLRIMYRCISEFPSEIVVGAGNRVGCQRHFPNACRTCERLCRPNIGQAVGLLILVYPDGAQLPESVDPDVALHVLAVGGALHVMVQEHPVERLVYLFADAEHVL